MLVVLRAGVTFDGSDPRGAVSFLVREGRIALRLGPGAAAAASATVDPATADPATADPATATAEPVD